MTFKVPSNQNCSMTLHAKVDCVLEQQLYLPHHFLETRWLATCRNNTHPPIWTELKWMHGWKYLLLWAHRCIAPCFAEEAVAALYHELLLQVSTKYQGYFHYKALEDKRLPWYYSVWDERWHFGWVPEELGNCHIISCATLCCNTFVTVKRLNI